MFPHHTFWWEGIDGTTQYTHFPPADTYNCQLTGKELAYVEKNYKDKGRSHIALSPTGWGDGGGGPTREQLAAGRRAANLEGSPKVEFSSPTAFFERSRAEYADAPRWNGELYLELHRGTYSSQIRGKQGNRRSEALMHDVEKWSALAARLDDSFEYPYAEINELWEKVLLLQFHDILPGSSIAWVHKETEHNYEDIAERGEELVEKALEAIARAKDTGAGKNSGDGETAGEVTCEESDGCFALSNGHVSATIDADGHLVSLRAGESGRELIAPGAKGALLQLHRDTPNAWDSWDIDEFYRRVGRDLAAVGPVSVEREGEAVHVRATYETRTEGVRTEERPYPGAPSNGAGSRIVLTYVLSPGVKGLEVVLDVDWHERKKVLKLAFPFDLRAAHMASEIQFGHIERPIPVNTLDDFGRFETCAHRWVRVHEGDRAGSAVALANDSSYGHDVRRCLRESDGGTTTIVRATVIRAAEFPDPRAEEGQYRMRYSLVPGASIADAIDEGTRLNQAPRDVDQDLVDAALARIEGEGTSLRLQTLKLAEDQSGDLIVRLYESEGVRGEGVVVVPGAKEIVAVDLLERELTEESVLHYQAQRADGDGIMIAARPFQIVTLRARLN